MTSSNNILKFDSSEMEIETNMRTWNFPGFGELSIPESLVQGNCGTLEEFKVTDTLKSDESDVIGKAERRMTGENVTLIHHKKIKESDDEVLEDFLRELSIIRQLNHPNSLKFISLAVDNQELTSTYIVCESVSCLISDIIEKNMDNLYVEATVKNTMEQLLTGLVYLEENSIMHRNIHPGTLAFAENGILKITNFREARRMSDIDKRRIFSKEFRYQPLELLMLTPICGPPIDVWSAACVFAQLLLREPLFKSNGRKNVVRDILKMFGKPTEEIWPDFVQLSLSSAYLFEGPFNRNTLQKYFALLEKTQPDTTMKLLYQMFLFDPKCRYTARDCLNSSYFNKTSEE